VHKKLSNGKFPTVQIRELPRKPLGRFRGNYNHAVVGHDNVNHPPVEFPSPERCRGRPIHIGPSWNTLEPAARAFHGRSIRRSSSKFQGRNQPLFMKKDFVLMLCRLRTLVRTAKSSGRGQHRIADVSFRQTPLGSKSAARGRGPSSSFQGTHCPSSHSC
jgi:hypothetical protein